MSLVPWGKVKVNEVSVKTFNNSYGCRENIIVVNDPFREK